MAGRGMKILSGLVAAVVAVGVIGYGLVMNVPAVQNALMERTVKERLSSGASDKIMEDGALHVVLCGTGSPMPDPTRANACTAIVAGGHIVIVDTGPGSWAKFARTRLPGGKIDAVLFTHLHSDHIGDIGEFATQSWIAGRTTPTSNLGLRAVARTQCGRR